MRFNKRIQSCTFYITVGRFKVSFCVSLCGCICVVKKCQTTTITKNCTKILTNLKFMMEKLWKFVSLKNIFNGFFPFPFDFFFLSFFLLLKIITKLHVNHIENFKLLLFHRIESGLLNFLIQLWVALKLFDFNWIL